MLIKNICENICKNMIRGIHYFSTELKTKIDVILRGCFKYTFFDNVGTNLHRNDTWDIFPACSWLSKLTIFYRVFTSSMHQIKVYFRGCTGTLAKLLNPPRLHVSALSRLKYGNNGIQIKKKLF